MFQLLECYDEALRKDLTRSFRNLTSYDEPTLLVHIKSLAVGQKNVMVAPLQLQQRTQDRDEPVRVFSACLKGQANVCQYDMIKWKETLSLLALLMKISALMCWARPTKRCHLRKQSASLTPKKVGSALLVKSTPSQQLYLWQSMQPAVHTGRWREDGFRAGLQTEKLSLKTNYAVAVVKQDIAARSRSA
ncbi:hypothetical protein PoB_004338400 [Plakobranchus ocellatus]|uniref:Uncharacterized protein n=1 Tax=Plakobranchus ocellatus TaxID=259542 RepID=A0AAV4B9R6_9GAST|nr:hypothetical protein PoB_004338400 [Plakobranchus ocellatus]